MRHFLAGAVSGAAAVTVVFVLAVGLWPWRVEATRTPGAGEVTAMKSLLNRAVEREAVRLANPFPPSADNLMEGMKLFRDDCAGCHGDGAQPSLWGTTSFFPRVPQFATEPPHRPEWQIYWIVKNGIRNTGMGAWGQLMTDDQLWKVSGFLSHVNSLLQEVADAWSKRQ